MLKRLIFCTSLLCFLLLGGILLPSCQSPECGSDSDCTGHHESCKDGKCVHDHSKHHSDKDGGIGTAEFGGNADAGNTNDTTKREAPSEARAADTTPTRDEPQPRDDTPTEAKAEPDKAAGKTVGELERCNQTNKCGPNLSCIVFTKGAQEGLCLKSVSSCTGGPCGSGYRCIAVRSGGVCLRLCGAAQSCPNQLQCKHLHFAGGHADGCVP